MRRNFKNFTLIVMVTIVTISMVTLKTVRANEYIVLNNSTEIAELLYEIEEYTEWKSEYVKYTRSFMFEDELVDEQYEVYFDGTGNYRYNVLSGPNEGNYDVLLDDTLYQYFKASDLLLKIDVSKDGRVVPDIFFTSEIVDRAITDLKTKKALNVNEKALNKNNDLVIETNSNYFVESDTKKHLERTGRNNSKKELVFDLNNNRVLKEAVYINNKLSFKIEVDEHSKLKTFSKELLNISGDFGNIMEISPSDHQDDHSH